MIHALLARLEHNPESLFSESDFATSDGLNFLSWSKSNDLLQALPIDPSAFGVSTADGRVLDVADDGFGCELFDPEDPEFEPIPVDVTKLRRWRVNLEKLASLLARENGTRGNPELVRRRLLLLGLDAHERLTVFALYPSWEEARSEVGSLVHEHQGAKGYLICGRNLKPTIAEANRLNELRIFLAGVDDHGVILTPDGSSASTTNKGARSRAGRPRGRGLGSLLDCWVNCHHLETSFLTVNEFYKATAAYLLNNPGLVSSVPPIARFASLRYNGSQLRREEGRCAWHQHLSPPPVSHLLSY